MTEGQQNIRVHFGRPFPLFPLDGVVLLPHAMVRLFIFEPRYRQMLESVLDGSGQIAMAVYDRADGPHANGSSALRPAVCIGQVVSHERQDDGNYHVWMQGVCRARIAEEFAPDGERLYREAQLAPVELQETPSDALARMRDRLADLLTEGACSELSTVRALLQQFEAQETTAHDLPPDVLFEVVGLSVIGGLDRGGLLYELLGEGDPEARARRILGEIDAVNDLMGRAVEQFDPEAPSGVSWN